ncbi:TonB-dependent receptor [Lewinella sp. IMCC34183]|uniref:TonB-dependent receptor n=1 Tax=Lewinella sp. IMCC34183 TaxID=2248762 RepID=UPI000E2632F1|nr:TonB-dependent receptor [Lewinella sp. IMCC34183]
MKPTLTLFFLLLCTCVRAQTLSGRVLDDSNLPLPGATLYLDGDGIGVTDQDGYFSPVNLPVGEHELSVTYIGFTPAFRTVTLERGRTATLDIVLRPGVQLAEVAVISQLRGQARAINQQRAAVNITNVIAADQIGRFPDQNIGDALKRVSGINVQYDQGEARFANIRGTAPQLNAVTINGERVPSAEAEVRSVQLDLIPSDMVQAVEVTKALTPDMDADAIGGSVNLVTRAAPYERRISGTLGGGYNFLAGKPSVNGSLIYGERFANNALGVIVSGSYFNNQLGSDDVEAEWTYADDPADAYPAEVQIRQYYLQRVRRSLSLGLDYKIAPNHTVFLRGIYNQRSDFENRYVAEFTDIERVDGQWMAELNRETKAGTADEKYARLEDQSMATLNLNGEHLFGDLIAKWSVNYARADEERPHERYLEFGTGELVPVDVDFTNPRRPYVSATEAAFQRPGNAWELAKLTEEFQFTKDEDVNGRLDLALPLAPVGDYRNTLKFGGRVRTKDKVRENDFYEYEPTDAAFLTDALGHLVDQSRDNFLAGDYASGAFADREYVGNLNLTGAGFEGARDLSELAGNFSASENIVAGYAMLEQQLGPQLLAVAGLRVERTDLNYAGFRYDEAEESLTPTGAATSAYTNLLPGLHLKYQPEERSVFRFAYTNTLARPNYYDLVPYRSLDDRDRISIGNPDIDPTLSMNLDLMAEHYFGGVGMASAGLFYKDIRDFIVDRRLTDYSFEGRVYDRFTQPVNGGNARLLGLELGLQRQLDFIAPALAGVAVYFNYTYIDSRVTDFNFDGRESDGISLPGSPRHTLNASLGYDTGKLTTRLSFNYASDFIDGVGEEAFEDVYYDRVTYLDFNANFAATPRLTLYANANNLLNQPLRYFQGASLRTYQGEYYGVRVDAGVKFDLTR